MNIAFSNINKRQGIQLLNISRCQDIPKNGLHSTRLIPVLSISWKCGLYFVCIFIADCIFLNKLSSSDLSFNRKFLAFQCLKSETSAHVQLRNYFFYAYDIQVSRHGVSWKLTSRIALDKSRL